MKLLDEGTTRIWCEGVLSAVEEVDQEDSVRWAELGENASGGRSQELKDGKRKYVAGGPCSQTYQGRGRAWDW